VAPGRPRTLARPRGGCGDGPAPIHPSPSLPPVGSPWSPVTGPRSLGVSASLLSFRSRGLLIRRGARPPAHNGPDAEPCPLVVGDERKVPAQLDDAGQLAALFPGPADRRGGLLVNDEHARSLGVAHGRGKPWAWGRPSRPAVGRPVAALARGGPPAVFTVCSVRCHREAVRNGHLRQGQTFQPLTAAASERPSQLFTFRRSARVGKRRGRPGFLGPSAGYSERNARSVEPWPFRTASRL
jgi:hypothetical protein